MIRHLELTNILLFESLFLPLHKGLTIVTGETGSGKSILFSALRWVLGEKPDINPVRSHEKMGIVEALFDITNNPVAQEYLKQEKIEFQDEIVIRREFSGSGKSRIFINDQCSSVSFLRMLGSSLVETVGQSAHSELLSFDSQLAIIDLFGNLEQEVANFAIHLAEGKEIERQVAELLAQKEKKREEEERLSFALDEITSLGYQIGEEQRLSQEEKMLRQHQEVEEKVHAILESLSDGHPALISGLKSIHTLLASLAKISSSFHEHLAHLQNAMVELEELSYSLRQLHKDFSFSYERMAEIEERLSQIYKIKKKYGNSDDALISFQKEAQERLRSLENLDRTLAELEERAKEKQKICNTLAASLSEKRKKAACSLEKRMNEELALLNMDNSQFFISFHTKERSAKGDEGSTFLLKANTGEKTAAISLSASGGELSRICFALKIIFSEKNRTSLLIFDEIDANVGGRTAAVIGKKLKELSEKKQVLAITHFVQVAHSATTHLTVQKQERNGRTFSSVEELSKETREMEYQRMLGSALSFPEP